MACWLILSMQSANKKLEAPILLSQKLAELFFFLGTRPA